MNIFCGYLVSRLEELPGAVSMPLGEKEHHLGWIDFHGSLKAETDRDTAQRHDAKFLQPPCGWTPLCCFYPFLFCAWATLSPILASINISFQGFKGQIMNEIVISPSLYYILCVCLSGNIYHEPVVLLSVPQEQRIIFVLKLGSFMSECRTQTKWVFMASAHSLCPLTSV